jgi:uncharacterized protein YwgA
MNNCETKASKEMSTSKVMMLSLISLSNKKGWLGITKIQKFCFLVDYYLSLHEKRAFNYDFFMYDLGPMSKDVYNDFEFLLDEKLVVEGKEGIKATEIGQSIIEQSKEIIPKDINTIMHKIVDQYAPMDTDDLVRIVHKSKIKLPNGTVSRIEDLPRCFTILPQQLTNLFKIGENYLETFRIMSDKPLYEAIQFSRKKGEKSKPFEPLVST